MATAEPSFIVQIFVAVGGLTGIAALVSAFLTRRKINSEAAKTGADAAQVLSAASVALLEPMEKQLKSLSDQLTRSQTRANQLDDTLQSTQRELRDAQRMAHELNLQLTYYRNKYGPPTDELERIH